MRIIVGCVYLAATHGHWSPGRIVKWVATGNIARSSKHREKEEEEGRTTTRWMRKGDGGGTEARGDRKEFLGIGLRLRVVQK